MSKTDLMLLSFLVPLTTEGANLHSQEVEEKKMAEEVSNVNTRIF
jgi:hypothetical protein